jgi:hypothetical protein
LEPLEESDLNLKDKFSNVGNLKKEKTPELKSEPEMETKNINIDPIKPEVEKKEREEGAMEKEDAYAKILSKTASVAPVLHSDENVKKDAEEANLGTDAESKLKNLVVLAETKGLPHAVKVARHMEDNYTLDEFHDRLLSEELHSALLKKGLIKEV